MLFVVFVVFVVFLGSTSVLAGPTPKAAVLTLGAEDDVVTLRAQVMTKVPSSSSLAFLDERTTGERLKGPAAGGLALGSLRAEFDAAEAVFVAGDHERSVAMLESLVSRQENDPDFTKEKALFLEQVRLHLAERLVGLAGPAETGKAETPNGKRALHHLAQVVRSHPAFSFDPRRHPPKMRALLARATADVAQAGVGSMRVWSTPTGAQVLLEGTLVGTTPLSLSEKIPAGRYRLWLTREDDVSLTRTVDVIAGGSLAVEIDLSFESALVSETKSLQLTRPFTARDWQRLAALLNIDVLFLLGIEEPDQRPTRQHPFAPHTGRSVFVAVVDGHTGGVSRGARRPWVSSGTTSDEQEQAALVNAAVVAVVDVLSGGGGDRDFVAPAPLLVPPPALMALPETDSASSPLWAPWVVGAGVSVAVVGGLVGAGVAGWLVWSKKPTETFSVTVVEPRR